jgi:hypothetical protein
MLAKVLVGLVAVAAISYGGAAVYMGGCPFSACGRSHCNGQPAATTSSCCQTPSSSSSCTESEMACCETDDVTTGLVGICGTAVAGERAACEACPVAATAAPVQP